jgi:hypothetical protein
MFKTWLMVDNYIRNLHLKKWEVELLIQMNKIIY